MARATLLLLLIPLVAEALAAHHAPRLARAPAAASSARRCARAPAPVASTTLDPNSERVNVSGEDLVVAGAASAAPAHGPLHPLMVLWRFSRPHTLIGSALCIPALSLFAAPAGMAAPALVSTLVPVVLYATLPSLLINIYITGLNQLFDVEIDKVNKPKLPLASGEMSIPAGWATVLTCLALGVGLGLAPSPLASPALLATLLGSVFLGTIYSTPPFRLKRFPLMASFCIMSVRGALINWGFFQHAATTAFGAATLPAGRLAALTGIYVSIYLYICLYLSISIYIHMSIYISLSISLYVYS